MDTTQIVAIPHLTMFLSASPPVTDGVRIYVGGDVPRSGPRDYLAQSLAYLAQAGPERTCRPSASLTRRRKVQVGHASFQISIYCTRYFRECANTPGTWPNL
jgi:hypothetical protein